ncbi:MAG: hypothetical protein PHF89_04860 [Eubacteriales bacterium]|nr:hypothetical protein [Eubacteriales bacterium]
MSNSENKNTDKSIITYKFFKDILRINADKAFWTTIQLESILPDKSFEKFEKFIKFSVMKQANDYYYDCLFNEFRHKYFKTIQPHGKEN